MASSTSRVEAANIEMDFSKFRYTLRLPGSLQTLLKESRLDKYQKTLTWAGVGTIADLKVLDGDELEALGIPHGDADFLVEIAAKIIPVVATPAPSKATNGVRVAEDEVPSLPSQKYCPSKVQDNPAQSKAPSKLRRFTSGRVPRLRSTGRLAAGRTPLVRHILPPQGATRDSDGGAVASETEGVPLQRTAGIVNLDPRQQLQSSRRRLARGSANRMPRRTFLLNRNASMRSGGMSQRNYSAVIVRSKPEPESIHQHSSSPAMVDHVVGRDRSIPRSSSLQVIPGAVDVVETGEDDTDSDDESVVETNNSNAPTTEARGDSRNWTPADITTGDAAGPRLALQFPNMVATSLGAGDDNVTPSARRRDLDVSSPKRSLRRGDSWLRLSTTGVRDAAQTTQRATHSQSPRREPISTSVRRLASGSSPRHASRSATPRHTSRSATPRHASSSTTPRRLHPQVRRVASFHQSGSSSPRADASSSTRTSESLSPRAGALSSPRAGAWSSPRAGALSSPRAVPSPRSSKRLSFVARAAAKAAVKILRLKTKIRTPSNKHDDSSSLSPWVAKSRSEHVRFAAKKFLHEINADDEAADPVPNSHKLSVLDLHVPRLYGPRELQSALSPSSISSEVQAPDTNLDARGPTQGLGSREGKGDHVLRNSPSTQGEQGLRRMPSSKRSRGASLLAMLAEELQYSDDDFTATQSSYSSDMDDSDVTYSDSSLNNASPASVSSGSPFRAHSIYRTVDDTAEHSEGDVLLGRAGSIADSLKQRSSLHRFKSAIQTRSTLCEGTLMKRSRNFPFKFSARMFVLSVPDVTGAAAPLLTYAVKRRRPSSTRNANETPTAGEKMKVLEMTCDHRIQVNPTTRTMLVSQMDDAHASLILPRQLGEQQFALVKTVIGASPKKRNSESHTEVLRLRCENGDDLVRWVHCLCHVIAACKIVENGARDVDAVTQTS